MELLRLEDFFISDDEEFDRLQAILDEKNRKRRRKSNCDQSAAAIGNATKPKLGKRFLKAAIFTVTSIIWKDTLH